MSVTISISTCTKQKEAPDTFKSVYLIFLNNLKKIVIKREKWLTQKEIKLFKENEIIVTNLSSGKKEQVFQIIDESYLSFQLNSIITSKEKIIASIPYQISEKYEVGIDLEIYGENYENGHAVKNEGYSRVIFSLNDLQRPINDIVELKDLNNNQDLLSDTDYKIAVKTVNNAYENIFQNIALSTPTINHCVGYLESGIPLPLFSSSIYHANQRDYILDLWRIYIGYYFDIEPVVLYNVYDEKIFLSMLDYLSPRIRGDQYFQVLHSKFPEAFKFISDIKLEKLKYTTELSRIETSDLLASTKYFIEFHIPSANVHVSISKDSACMVFGNPEYNIWKFYETFYNLIPEKEIRDKLCGINPSAG
jgi:hypothetical protein